MQRRLSQLFIVTAVLCLFMVTPCFATEISHFTDIEDGAVAEAAEYLYAHGIVSGTGDRCFSPGHGLTYAELAVILQRVVPLEGRAGEFWYSGSMLACTEAGYVIGDPAQPVTKAAFLSAVSKACPEVNIETDTSNSPISRAEMALILQTVLTSREVAIHTIFDAEEVQQALGENGDRIATLSDIINTIYLQEEVAYDPTYLPSSSEPATADAFLGILSTAFDGVYYRQENGEYIYPAEDSKWMSAAEWDALVKDPNQVVTLGTVEVLVKRTVECNKYLNSHRTAFTYERYHEVIEDFFPEFLDIIERNERAVTYWLDPNPNSGMDITLVLM